MTSVDFFVAAFLLFHLCSIILIIRNILPKIIIYVKICKLNTVIKKDWENLKNCRYNIIISVISIFIVVLQNYCVLNCI